MNDLKKKGEFRIDDKEIKKINEIFCSESLSENETKLVLSDFFEKEKILIDPHTAVGIGVTKKIPLEGKTVILSTAHPSKFPDAVENATNKNPELPDTLQNILTKKENYIKLSNDLNVIQNYILKKI